MRQMRRNTMTPRVLMELVKRANEDGVFHSDVMNQIFEDLGMASTYAKTPYDYLRVNLIYAGKYVVRLTPTLHQIRWETMEQLMELGFDQSIPAGIS